VLSGPRKPGSAIIPGKHLKNARHFRVIFAVMRFDGLLH
jgi:hypothetical protein